MKKRSFALTMFYYIFAPVLLILPVLLPLTIAKAISEATKIPYPLSIALVFTGIFTGIFIAYRKRQQIRSWIVKKVKGK